MKRLALPILALLALVACEKPATVIAREKKIAVRVTMTAHFPGIDAQGEEEMRASYQEQVKARLKGLADVVTDAEANSSARPLLEINIEDLSLSGFASKGDVFQGWAFDRSFTAAMEGITRAARNEHGPIEHQGELSDTLIGRYVTRGIQKSRLERLGYRPFLISGTLSFTGAGNEYRCDFDGWKLLPLMKPLPKEAGKDQTAQIRQEEAKGLAEYVMKRMHAEWEWMMSPDR